MKKEKKVEKISERANNKRIQTARDKGIFFSHYLKLAKGICSKTLKSKLQKVASIIVANHDLLGHHSQWMNHLVVMMKLMIESTW